MNITPEVTDQASVFVNLGKAFSDRGEWAEAMEHTRKALVLNPFDTQAHFNMGVMQEHLGNTEAAIDSYESALALDGPCVDARYNLGLLYVETGNPMEALKNLLSYVKHDPASNWAIEAKAVIERIKSVIVLKGGRDA